MKRAILSLLVLMSLLSSAAQAAVVLRVSNGQLAGATGVLVGGRAYDVTFGFDSCVALFAGCNEPSDFTFQTVGDAAAASQALLDQVFVDGPAGNFNVMRDILVGCSSPVTGCGVMTPYRLSPLSTSFVDTYWAVQLYQLAFFESTALMNTRQIGQQHIYAIWSPAEAVPPPDPGQGSGPPSNPVSEPGIFALVATAAFACFTVTWSRRRRGSASPDFYRRLVCAV